MTPKDLEHWRRIFKAGALGVRSKTYGAGEAVADALNAMSKMSKKILDEENAKDAEGDTKQ